MADQTATVPYNDSYDNLYIPDYTIPSMHPDYNWTEIPSFDSSMFDTVSAFLKDDGIENTVPDVVDFEVGNSGDHETGREMMNCIVGGEGDIGFVQEFEFDVDELPLRVWSSTQRPESCSHCEVLREILHTNGVHTARLEIHGSIGLISHGILENEYNNLGPVNNSRDYQFLEFHDRKMETVKKFLKWYIQQRVDDGYMLRQEQTPSSAFLETLCIGLQLDWHNNILHYHHDDQVNGSEGIVQQEGGLQVRDDLVGVGQEVIQAAVPINQVVMRQAATFPPLTHHQAVVMDYDDRQDTIPLATPQRPQLVNEEMVLHMSTHDHLGDKMNLRDETIQHGADKALPNQGSHFHYLEAGANNPHLLLENNIPTDAGARTQLSLKRERAATLTFADISVYFHLPILKASIELDLCVTSIKRKLRSFGIPRWPYRKVSSLRRKIDGYEKDLGGADEEKRVHAQLELPRLRLELANIYAYRGNADVPG